MIKGVHAMFYTNQAEELRAFLRDKLGFPWTDAGEGWLIFQAPEVEIGCHPESTVGPKPAGMHEISFYCDNLEQTVEELRGRGVEFTGEICDQGYGLVISFQMPGGVTAGLYQPKYSPDYQS